VKRFSVLVIGAAAGLLLAGCTTAQPSTTNPPTTEASTEVGASAVPSPRTPTVELPKSYKSLLEQSGKKGWVVTDEQKLAGSAGLTQSTVLGCTVGLTLLDTSSEPTYHVTTLNSEPLEFYGDEAAAALGKPGISRADFEAALKRLQDQGKITFCQ
jgi:hypothetical protein